MPKKLSYFLRLAISVGLVFSLFRLVPYDKLIHLYANSRKIYVLASLLIFFMSFFICVWRWKLLLSAIGIKAPFGNVFGAYFSSNFLNLFFPSFIAGDIFRSFVISKRYGSAKKVASTVLMDRFAGAAALILLALISFLARIKMLNQPQVLLSLFILSLVLATACCFIFSRRFFHFFTGILGEKSNLRRKLDDFHQQVYFFKLNPRVFAQSMLLSLIVQFFTALGFYVCSKAFGINVNIFYFLIIVPIVMSIALIPITVAGIGLRERASVVFFSLIGIDSAVSLGMSLVNLAYVLFSGILGGILYVALYHRRFQLGSQSTPA